jgi:Peptidase M50B-like
VRGAAAHHVPVTGLDLLPAAAAATPPPSDEVALLGGAAAALAGCVLRPLWPTARLVVTAVHELGHALAAILLGGRVNRVHLWLNTAGLTSYSLPGGSGPARSAAVVVAGYPAPGIAGMLGALLVVSGLARWWVAAGALVALTLLVLWVRNPWGIWSTVLGAAVLGWLAWAGPPRLVTAVGGGLVVLLLVGGWRAAVAHASGRERGLGGVSDAVLAARFLPLPALAFRALFVVAASASLLAGAWLLLAAAAR